MSRYTASSRQTVAERPQTHAIWRGIGCLLVLIVPLISWVLAAATVQFAMDQDWPVPYQLVGYPIMPQDWWKVPGLPPVLLFIQNQQNLYAVLSLCIIYIILFAAVLSALYAFVYRFVGPPRYGPLDAPPPKVKVRSYKR
jgi:hypothetical protein